MPSEASAKEGDSRKLQTYIGYSSDLKRRLAAHNNGESLHTAKHMPWNLEGYVAFADEKRARDFEAYLKSGSGKAFANKRLWSYGQPAP